MAILSQIIYYETNSKIKCLLINLKQYIWLLKSKKILELLQLSKMLHKKIFFKIKFKKDKKEKIQA